MECGYPSYVPIVPHDFTSQELKPVNKTTLLATSILPAAIAGFLCFLLAMAFVNHFDQMATMMQVLAGLTLLAAAAVALMPVGILLFGPKAGAKPDKKATKSKRKDEDAATATESEPEELESLEDDTFGAEAAEDTEAMAEDDMFVEGEAEEFQDLDMDEFPEDEGKVK